MEAKTNEPENPICPFCGLPIEPWQEKAQVEGKPMHFDCYREKAG